MRFHRNFVNFITNTFEGMKNLIFKIPYAKKIISNPTFIAFELSLILVIIYVMNRDKLSDGMNETIYALTNFKMLPIWIGFALLSTIGLRFMNNTK